MINYNEYDIESIINCNYKAGFDKILEYLQEESVEDEEVWEEARLSETIPDFASILIRQTFERLEDTLTYRNDYYSKLDLKITYYVNNRDSHFYINGEEIRTLNDFKDLIRRIVENLNYTD